MRPFWTFLCAALLLMQAHAQSNKFINYQAVAINAQGNAIESANIGVQIAIRENALNGTVIYRENHNVTTSAIGIFSLKIGNGSVVLGIYDQLDWSTPKFLEVLLDVNGGTNFTSLGVVQFVSVPYALFAERAGSDGDHDPENETIGSVLFDADTRELEVIENDISHKVTIPAVSGTYHYLDRDQDGFGSAFHPVWVPTGIEPPALFILDNTDCADDLADAYPGADEVCDEQDNNCDGVIDEGVTTAYYADADGDGYGDPANEIQACQQPQGYVDNGLDCDDSNEYTYPGSLEVCDGQDNDCNGEIDNECLNECLDSLIAFFTCYDICGGGSTCANQCAYLVEQDCIDLSCSFNIFQNEHEIFDDTWTAQDKAYYTLQECGVQDADGDGYPSNNDCDDNDDTIYPGAPEICGDGIDQNCNGSDHLCGDEDFDGYVGDDDCNNEDPEINIGAQEECGDGVDNDCDGTIDVLPDNDGDGYTICDGDCDDYNDQIYPGAPDEIDERDPVDSNCDGFDGVDGDGDGYLSVEFGGDDCDDSDPAINPSAADDGGEIDYNCDGCSLANEGESYECFSSNGDWSCSGVVTCTNGVWSACSAPQPTYEGGCGESDSFYVEALSASYVYAAAPTRLRLTTSGLTAPPAAIRAIDELGNIFELNFTQVAENEFDIIVSVPLSEGSFAIQVLDENYFYATTFGMFTITSSQDLLFEFTDMILGSIQNSTPAEVTISGGVGFSSTPTVYLLGGSSAIAFEITSVTLVNSEQIMVEIPAGLEWQAYYDLIVINPDGSAGYVPQWVYIED